MSDPFEYPDDGRSSAPPGRLGKVPPHDLEAEEALLGAMLLNRDAIADAVNLIRPEHFYGRPRMPMCTRRFARCTPRGSRPMR